LIGTVATLPAIVSASSVLPPSLLIVGEVVQLHERLAWFEPR
jgi:uroporphyrin-III C-methyltransferase / precorrin-2 dehydrogenase / sirohydrochlorin ferrochelatase